jgi:cytochrome c oxidase subunit 3
MTEKHEKTSLLSQGVYIFVYLAVLTLLEFFVAITFKSVALLVVVALVKAALVVYYYMHISSLNAVQEGDHDSYAYKTGTNRLGLWLFLVSDAFVFGGLMVVRLNLLGLTRPHLNQTLGLFVTAVLLISSFFMNRGETLLHNGDRKGFLNNTLITFLLGLGFLLGVVLIEWHTIGAIAEPVLRLFGEPEGREPLKPTSGTAGAVFFMMTGMHAFHVLTGLIFLAIVWINGRRGLYDEKQYPVEAAAVYWHFVDVVWIFFYPALYLIGTAL